MKEFNWRSLPATGALLQRIASMTNAQAYTAENAGQLDTVYKNIRSEVGYEEVRKDELYFLASCGGVTFGGGEPLLQSEFIRQFRQLCGPEWRITVETSLNVPQQNVEELISIIDNYIIDIKDMNNNIYQRYTGKNNENVLGNFIACSFEPIKYFIIV